MPTDVYYVVIECPNTGRATRTGVEVAEIGAFTFVGLQPTECACQHCPEVHVWTQKNAWVERHQASRVHVRAAVAKVS